MNSFAHLEHVKCLTKPDTLFDIAILGVPFDTAVSYRPGSLSHHTLSALSVVSVQVHLIDCT